MKNSLAYITADLAGKRTFGKNNLLLFVLITALMVGLVGQPGRDARAGAVFDQTDGVFNCSAQQSEIPPSECDALTDLFRGTAGISWITNDNWLLTATPCSWYGVTCEGGLVSALALPGNNLSGDIPSGLGNLLNLKNLDLSGNKLTGSLPAGMGGISGLGTLNVAYNQLSGSIPLEMTNLAALTNLELGYNMLWASDADLLVFLSDKALGWADTQTVCPTDLQVVDNSIDHLLISWTAIPYTSDGGYYEVSWSTSLDGTYAVAGVTADKLTSEFTSANISIGDYYFRLRSFTPAHGIQLADLWSAYTAPILVQLVEPQPELGFIMPNHKGAGAAGFDLKLIGSHFTPGSKVLWNGAELTTIFISSSELSAVVPAQNLLSSGTRNISVRNPAPGGGTSGLWVFNVSPITSAWSSASPEGGMVHDIEISRANPLVIYAATDVAGVYKTIDGGQTWLAANKGIEGLGFYDIEISPINASTVIVGGATVYISIDAGVTWTYVMNSGNGEREVIKFDPTDPNIITIGTNLQLLQTSDGGQTWSDIGKYPDKHVISVEVDPKNPDIIYEVIDETEFNTLNFTYSLWKTVNGGVSWTKKEGLPISSPSTIAINPTNPLVLYAITDLNNPSQQSQISKSEDGGTTWSSITVGGRAVMPDIEINVDNPDQVFISTTGGLYISMDAGAHWNHSAYPDSCGWGCALAVRGVNAEYFFGAGFLGLFASLDQGLTWHAINSGLHAHDVRFLEYSNITHLLWAATAVGGLWKSGDYGENWVLVGEESYIHNFLMDPNDPNHLFVNNWESKDGGATWVAIGDEPIIFTVDSGVIGFHADHIWKSMDGGITVQEKSGKFPICVDSCFPNQLAADPINPDVLYAMMYQYSDPNKKYSSLYKTIDGGDSWIAIEKNIETEGYFEFAIDPSNGNTLYLTTNLALYKSSDGGGNWEKLVGISRFKSGATTALVVDPIDSQLLYVGGLGVFTSLDGGVSWVDLCEGINPGLVWAIRPIHSNTYAGIQALSINNSRLYSVAGGQVNEYVDNSAPTVKSIQLASSNPSKALIVNFKITFSEPVFRLSMVAPFADFALWTNGISGAAITSVSGSESVYNVTVLTGTGNGSIRLDIPTSATITDITNNSLVAEPYNTGPVYTMDKTAPTVKSIQLVSGNPSKALTVDFKITFSEPVKGLSNIAPFTDFALFTSGLSGAAIKSVSGTGAIYTVTVSTGTGNGSIRLDIPTGAIITDIANNALMAKPYTSGPVFRIAKTLEKNGNFEAYPSTISKIPNYWTVAGFGATDGKFVSAKEGKYAILITGSAGKTKSLTQTVTLTGKLADPFTFSYMIKSSLQPVTGTCQGQVAFYYGATLKGVKTLKCPTGSTYAWKKATLNFTAPAAYTKVVITFTYSKSSGSVWIDMLNLAKNN
jgi:photosystem II stability/assembly factor-like uncharacterized protein